MINAVRDLVRSVVYDIRNRWSGIRCAHCLRTLGAWHASLQAVRVCKPPKPPWLDDLRRALRETPK